jgi:DNA-directed RNA polymerase subunit RPC12/RpoP
MISLRCDTCSETYHSDERHVGAYLLCKKCGNTIIIKPPSSPKSADVEADLGQRPEPTDHTTQSANVPWMTGPKPRSIGGGKLVQTIIALLSCLMLGFLVSAYGVSALLWFPGGFALSLFYSAQLVLPILMGLPRAIYLVAKHQMRWAAVGWLLMPPIAWTVALLAFGFFFPRAALFLAHNVPFAFGDTLGFPGPLWNWCSGKRPGSL